MGDSNIMGSIFNSNDYQRGKKDGYDDAMAGKDMSFLKMGTSLKFAIHGSNALDTYTSGYKAGYALGSSLRLLEQDTNSGIKPTATNSNSNKIKSTIKYTSAMPRGVVGQIDLLNQMKAFLQNQIEQFSEIEKIQAQFLNGLDSEMIEVSYLQNFEDFANDKKAHLDALVRSIEDEEIPYTEQVIRKLEDALQ